MFDIYCGIKQIKITGHRNKKERIETKRKINEERQKKGRRNTYAHTFKFTLRSYFILQLTPAVA